MQRKSGYTRHMIIPQRGNILFLILLAVVLFAALSYAVMGQREQITGIPRDKAETFAAQLIQNVNLIDNTMMRAMTVDGVKEWGFDISTSESNAPNGTCAALNCRIYSDRGGPVPMLKIPDWASTATVDGYKYPNFMVANILDVGTTAPDFYIRYDQLRKEVCEAINRKLGYTDIDLETADPTGGTDYGYNGTLTSMPTGVGTAIGNELATLKGRKTFCYRAGALGYYFLYVLKER